MPYRGLDRFTAADARAGYFVGRENDVEALDRLVSGESSVVVIGASGVGKSSLAAAGLGAAIEADRWFTANMRPGDQPLLAASGAADRAAT